MKQLLLFAIVVLIASCKKDEDQDQAKNYTIEVKVRDGVNYTLRSTRNSGEGIFMKVTPGGVNNVSHVFTESLKLNEGAFASITSVDYFKDEYFEVIVTDSSTGVVAAQKKEKGGVTVTWNVKNN